jgi:hypothetical protein
MTIAHAKYRARERYAKSLNRRSYYELCRLIKENKSECIKKVSNTRSIHRVEGMIAVYSNKSHRIITFLPPNCRELRFKVGV